MHWTSWRMIWLQDSMSCSGTAHSLHTYHGTHSLHTLCYTQPAYISWCTQPAHILCKLCDICDVHYFRLSCFSKLWWFKYWWGLLYYMTNEYSASAHITVYCAVLWAWYVSKGCEINTSTILNQLLSSCLCCSWFLTLLIMWNFLPSEHASLYMCHGCMLQYVPMQALEAVN